MKKEFKMKSRGLFDPGNGDKPFKISRSGIEMFVECPCCFYLDKRIGIRRPQGPPFNINKAVDTLLKKEFDGHRAAKTAHPLMTQYKIEAIPFQHEQIGDWRENFKGVQYHHQPTNLLITGAVDDVWVNPAGQLIVVDYKATSKASEIDLDSDWQMSYKRQMEVYQWLLRRNGFDVSPTGYFVYCNGRADKEAFDGKVEFDITVLPYTGNDDWIESALTGIKKCLDKNKAPATTADCEFCGYALARAALIQK